LLQVVVTLTDGVGRQRRRRRRSRSTDFLPSSAAAREPTRRQWQWRVEQRAATVSAVSEGFPALFLNFWGFIL
jgi:hypothetical protein